MTPVSPSLTRAPLPCTRERNLTMASRRAATESPLGRLRASSVRARRSERHRARPATRARPETHDAGDVGRAEERARRCRRHGRILLFTFVAFSVSPRLLPPNRRVRRHLLELVNRKRHARHLRRVLRVTRWTKRRRATRAHMSPAFAIATRDLSVPFLFLSLGIPGEVTPIADAISFFFFLFCFLLPMRQGRSRDEKGSGEKLTFHINRFGRSHVYVYTNTQEDSVHGANCVATSAHNERTFF